MTTSGKRLVAIADKSMRHRYITHLGFYNFFKSYHEVSEAEFGVLIEILGPHQALNAVAQRTVVSPLYSWENSWERR